MGHLRGVCRTRTPRLAPPARAASAGGATAALDTPTGAFGAPEGRPRAYVEGHKGEERRNCRKLQERVGNCRNTQETTSCRFLQ
eukprot:14789471-Alexandrium_andersonii.AAC.1